MCHRGAIHSYLFAFYSLAPLLPCYPGRVHERIAVIDGLHPVGEQAGGDAGAAPVAVAMEAGSVSALDDVP